MKQYKGWEIAKMICEGTLKEGDILKRSGFDTKIFKVVSKHLEYDNSDTELGSSFLASNDGVYEIIPKPVSFDEAINAGLEGKMIKVEHYSLNDSWNNIYFRINKIFEMLGKATLGGIPSIIKEGEWYIKESEVEE